MIRRDQLVLARARLTQAPKKNNNSKSSLECHIKKKDTLICLYMIETSVYSISNI